VIAVVGDLDGGLAEGFDHPHSFGELHPLAVDLDIDEVDWGCGWGRGSWGSAHVGTSGDGLVDLQETMPLGMGAARVFVKNFTSGRWGSIGAMSGGGPAM